VAGARTRTRTSVLPGSALILVENLSVPFDRRVWHECVALRSAGWDVSVVCPQGTKRDRDRFESIDGVAIHRFPIRFSSGGALDYGREYGVAMWRMWRIVSRLARTQRFDVVQACNPPDFLLLAALKLKRRGASFVFDQHDLVPELYLSRFARGKDLVYRATVASERVAFRLADVVIATNDSYRSVALGRGGKRPEDVFVVRNGPDLERFGPVEPDPALKQGREHLIGYLGVMGPQDGVDHALRALAQLVPRPDWHAVFIGEGDVWPQMKELAQELGLGDRVTFTGRIPDADVMRILSTCDVCLAPDPKSPLNDVSTMTKVMEYMAMGRPLVSYDLVEARVSAGPAALYAEPNEVDSFAARIAELLDDPELRRKLGGEGRSRVEGGLSWAHSERALVAAYERALEHRRR
jgi:glycosyltransferase involved in cell wall biosynthesis